MVRSGETAPPLTRALQHSALQHSREVFFFFFVYVAVETAPTLHATIGRTGAYMGNCVLCFFVDSLTW